MGWLLLGAVGAATIRTDLSVDKYHNPSWVYDSTMLNHDPNRDSTCCVWIATHSAHRAAELVDVHAVVAGQDLHVQAHRFLAALRVHANSLPLLGGERLRHAHVRRA